MTVFDRGLYAVDAATDQLAQLDGRFLLAALILQLAGLALRALVWRNVLAAAYPDESIPYPSIGGAYAAGVAVNAFTPARGGEVVKIALVRSRIAGSVVSTIAATLTVVVLLDLVLGALLLGGLAAFGVAAIRIPSVGPVPLLVVPLLLVAALVAFRLRPDRVRSLAAHLAQGAAILRQPCRYLRTVVPFQLLAWGCRIGVAFFVLGAFGIEAGIATAAFLVVLNGLSTAVPVPGGVGTQQVLAAYALRGITPVAGAVSFSVGLQFGITTVNTLVGLVALMLMLRTLHPLTALRAGTALARTSRVGQG